MRLSRLDCSAHRFKDRLPDVSRALFAFISRLTCFCFIELRHFNDLVTPSELRAHQLGDQSSTEPDPAAPLAPPHHLPQTNQNFQIYRQPTMPPGSGTAAAAAIYHASAPASRPGTAIAQPTVYYAAQPQGVISQPPIILQSMPVAPMIIQQPAGPSTQSFGPLRNTIPPLRPHPAQYPLSGPPPRGKGWCLTCAATGVVMSNGIEVYCPACGYGTLVDLPDGVQGSVECPGCAGNGVLNDEGRDRSIVGTVGSAVQAIGNEIAGLLGRERQTKPTISGPLAYCGMCRGSGLVNPQVVVVGQPVVAVPAGQVRWAVSSA